MNYYEILYIVNPNFERKKIDDAMKEIESRINKTKSKNILEATKLSMRRAIDKFNLSKANLIIDGNFTLDMDIEMRAIIKADDKFKEVMAASILAKYHRDNYMINLDKKFFLPIFK